MLPVAPPTSAAWAPWLEGSREWLVERDYVTAAWLAARARAEGCRIVVQGTSHAHSYRDNSGPLGALARAGDVATYKSPAGRGATFVHHADIRLLATAMSAAEDHPIAATEQPTFPLQGWAMATGALNLATGEITADERSSEQLELISTFVDQLYNGWRHPQVGRRACAYYLPKLAAAGMTYPIFVGSLIALDPRHLDRNDDIKAMTKALPATWTAEVEALRNAWAL